MQQAEKSGGEWRSAPWRIAAWSAAAALMLLPIAVQQISGNFGWTTFDFIFLAAVLGTGGLLFDLAARKAPNLFFLLGASMALAAAFGLFVVNGAVGLVGSEDEPRNLLFLAVILVALIGAFVTKLKPAGMARAMLAAAITHILVSAALLIDAGGVADGEQRMEIGGLSVFAALWLASAGLFRAASR